MNMYTWNMRSITPHLHVQIFALDRIAIFVLNPESPVLWGTTINLPEEM